MESDRLREELFALVRSLRSRVELDRELHHPLSWLVIGKEIKAPLPKEHALRKTDKEKVPDSTMMTVGTNRTEKPLEEIYRAMEHCSLCSLGTTRKNLVFGEGNPAAALVFVGEAPGADEDLQGRPFVGRAGQLLTKIIGAMGLKREDVYICNILKCRPPGNRNPLPEEIEVCEPHLIEQLKAIRPRIICALGTFAAQTLLKKKGIPITVLRGRFHDYHGIPLMPTYHPAYLLRNPAAKKQVWEDVQQIMKVLAEEESGEI
ncbi:DNA polymerase [Syntrophus gentianae]|uniref:Type-4 uracil-DNA glycosylase n=1 Tax=Syntrophus gentianae TaxID=43775 RepID=A0A1H7XDP6_9BACT|nr:uracil-DNA glycosylase [Syntrophus gentianae]SEM31851.1 DNA polymerase [Syntrophus gentianae]